MMNEKRSDLFKDLSDFYNFEKHVEFADYLNDIPAFEKEKFKRSLKFLSVVLGSNGALYQPGDYHPIIQYLSNHSQWSIQWLIWLGEVLARIQNCPNFSSIQKRLINSSKFPEGISVVEASYRFAHAGFDLSFDQEVTCRNKTKEADILLKNKSTDEQLFVEVSTLSLSQSQRQDANIWQIISFQSAFHNFAGRVFKSLSKESFEILHSELQAFYHSAWGTEDFMEFTKAGIIELAIGPKKNTQLLDLWCEEKKYKMNSFIFPQTTNPIQRIWSKLSSEQKQLPEGFPNLVFLKTENFLFHIQDKKHFMNEVQEILHQRKHILGLILSEPSLNNPDPVSFSKGMNFYLSTPRGNNVLLNDDIMFVLNKFSTEKVSPNLLDKIVKSITLD